MTMPALVLLKARKSPGEPGVGADGAEHAVDARARSARRAPPIQPSFRYRLLNVSPATAVGRANGKSIIASKNRRPGSG